MATIRSISEFLQLEFEGAVDATGLPMLWADPLLGPGSGLSGFLN